MNDEAIIKALKNGGIDQERALSFIYKDTEYREGVKMVVRGYRQLRLESWEGIFHESLIHLVKCVLMNKFRKETSLKNYFLGICRNKCREMIRKDKKAPPTLELPAEDPELVRSPIDIILSDELKDMLREAVNQLSASCQKVLRLWALSHSMKEIAEEMDYSGDRVAITYNSRCKSQLRKLLGQNPNLLNLLKEYRWL